MNIKLDIDYKAWRFNTVAAIPLVALVAGVSFHYPRIQFLAGTMVGIWAMAVHNLAWAWLTKRQQQEFK